MGFSRDAASASRKEKTMKSKKIFRDVKMSETESYGKPCRHTFVALHDATQQHIDSDSKVVLYNTKFKSRQVCGVSVRFGREHGAGG
jgi:hypothetical protein